MKKIIIFLGAIFLFLFSSCNNKKEEISLYMWGGSNEVNTYIDKIVIPYIYENEGIKVKRVPIVDIKDTVNKLLIEKEAGKKDGSIDVLWVNGENFKVLKETGVLEKDILSRVENYKLLKESTTIRDFGVLIEGYEVPFGEAQFNFIYDTRNGDVPFTSHQTLMEYAKNHKGRVTYPNVSNFTGSAFVRNIVIDILGYDNIISMSDEEFEKNLVAVWDYFKELKPYLWKEGKTYPENEGKQDLLFSNGEIDITMGYTINKVNSKIASGDYPESSKSFLLDKGTLFNNHYLAIPNNSKNKEDALKVINCLISPKLQMEKQKPENWGDYSVLDMKKLTLEEQRKFEEFTKSSKIPTMVELGEKRVMELPPEKLVIIEKGWVENIEKN